MNAVLLLSRAAPSRTAKDEVLYLGSSRATRYLESLSSSLITISEMIGLIAHHAAPLQ
jgi:hypothetical protein